MPNRMIRLVTTSIVAFAASAATLAQQFEYPKARKVDQVDTYHGVAVADPYRWLEDDNVADTAAWVEAENKVTFPYLDAIPFRKPLTDRVVALNNYEKYSAPSRKGPYVFFSKNDGLQNQSVLYIQKGLRRHAGGPDRSEHVVGGRHDAAERVRAVEGREVRGLRQSRRAAPTGRNTRSWSSRRRRRSTDTLEWVKVSGVALAGRRLLLQPLSGSRTKGKEKAVDQRGPPGLLPQGRHAAVAGRAVYEDAANPQRFHTVETTEDERFAILTISERGKGKDGNALFVRDLSKRRARVHAGHPDDRRRHASTSSTTSATSCSSRPTTTRRTGGSCSSIRSSRRRRTGRRSCRRSPSRSQGVRHGRRQAVRDLPQGRDDAAYVYSLDGTLENEIELPGPGHRRRVRRQHDDTFVFYTFNSLNVPPTIYRYDIATKKSTVFRAPKVPGYDPIAFETKQVFYPSKDGTTSARCSSCTRRA